MNQYLRALAGTLLVASSVLAHAQLTKAAIDRLKDIKNNPRLGPLVLPTGARSQPAPKAYTHLTLQVMSGTDDLRDGGTATFFMEMADGSRATAALAVPGVPLPGHTLLTWRWVVPDGLDPAAIRHVGITTQLHKGSRPTDRTDTWRISRVNAFFVNDSTQAYLNLFDEAVPYSFSAAPGTDEWKSGEVESYRGDQFTRTDELGIEVVSSSEPGEQFHPTVGWQVMVDLVDGRRFESFISRSQTNEGFQLSDIFKARRQLAQRSGRTVENFGRDSQFLRFQVPGITRGEIRRVLVMGQLQTTGPSPARRGGRVAQVVVWSKQSPTLWRQWLTYHPDFDVTQQDTLWATPPLAPLVLPQDIAGKFGVEIWAGPDDARSDSRIQLVAIRRPKDMFSQPSRFAETVAEARPGNTIGGIGRGSNVPANSMMRLGIIAPGPLTAGSSGIRLSEITNLGLAFEPGPGGGSWNPDTFTIRHIRFYYNDGKVLRELWSGYNLGVVLNTAVTSWMAGDPGFRIGTPLNLDPRRIGGG